MAYVNPAPVSGPVQVMGFLGNLNQCILCLRDWCQVEAARILMDPEDCSTYLYITRNYCNRVTPYDQFRMQLKTLLERPDKEYRHLHPYWDAFHRGHLDGMPVEDDPLFFYPIDLYRRLSRLADCAFDLDPEKNNRIREHNRIEADRIDHNIRLAFQNGVSLSP